MYGLTIIVSIILSILSTSIMTYISMATPIGPWIAPTLVLFAALFFKLFQFLFKNNAERVHMIAYATVAGSIGGIAATAVGFSFPALYFLDPGFFSLWVQQPFSFLVTISGLVFVASWLGMWLADHFEQSLLVRQNLSFPIGHLVYKLIIAQQQAAKAYELLTGFIGTTLFCIIQDGFALGRRIVLPMIPKTITILNRATIGIMSFPALHLDLWPLVWAIGFVTGHVIMVPLALGALSKIFVLNPINTFFFLNVSSMDFALSFASGMVLISAVLGMVKTPKVLWNGLSGGGGSINFNKQFIMKRMFNYETGLLFFSLLLFLSWLKFSLISQVYLIIGAIICTYQISVIAGKIGLAQLGRFATFVMVPALFLFKLSFLQVVIIATFVEVCGGVAVDILFGRKMSSLLKLPKQIVRRYQFLGILISSLSVGIVMLILINRFGLGTQELFAQRAYARALLIQSSSMNITILLIGSVFGYLLMLLKFSPMLVLGGLLMPLNITIGLIFGGLLTLLTKDRESWYPFWSGIFAANSLWMLIKALI